MGATIYLDYNATTPVDPRVVEAMLPYFGERFGNPSSVHRYGREARVAVDRARGQVAALIGARPDEIVFTSGGSESSNAVFKGVARDPRGLHVITTAVEHPATLVPLRSLADAGAALDVLPADGEGRVIVEAFDRVEVHDDRTALLSVMHANNEVGTLQPVAALAEIAHRRGGRVHVDAAQSVGKVDVHVDEIGADLLSLAGHKMYAPKGVGAMYLRTGTRLSPLIEGAGHEGGRRAGTENVALVVGLGVAAEIAAGELDTIGAAARAHVASLWQGLSESIGDVVRHGAVSASERLPNTLSVAFAGVDAAELVLRLGDTVAISQGAACHADGTVRSSVLDAMAVSPRLQKGTIRLSVGRNTTDEEVRDAVRHIARAVSDFRD